MRHESNQQSNFWDAIQHATSNATRDIHRNMRHSTQRLAVSSRHTTHDALTLLSAMTVVRRKIRKVQSDAQFRAPDGTRNTQDATCITPHATCDTNQHAMRTATHGAPRNIKHVTQHATCNATYRTTCDTSPTSKAIFGTQYNMRHPTQSAKSAATCDTQRNAWQLGLDIQHMTH